MSPTPTAELTQSPKTLSVWTSLMTWLAFFFQIFVQIVKGVPSVAQVLSFVGFRYPLLTSSQSQSTSQFKPLPVVEIPLTDSSSAAHLPDTVATSADGCGNEADDQQCLEKLTLVLDLDETLVCAYETTSLPVLLRSQATEAGLAWFELECASSDKDFDGRPKVNHVTVFERPGLRDFLKQTSEFADLVLFTAGLEGYASPLVDIIDTEKLIGLRLYRPSTSSTLSSSSCLPFPVFDENYSCCTTTGSIGNM